MVIKDSDEKLQEKSNSSSKFVKFKKWNCGDISKLHQKKLKRKN